MYVPKQFDGSLNLAESLRFVDGLTVWGLQIYARKALTREQFSSLQRNAGRNHQHLSQHSPPVNGRGLRSSIHVCVRRIEQGKEHFRSLRHRDRGRGKSRFFSPHFQCCHCKRNTPKRSDQVVTEKQEEERCSCVDGIISSTIVYIDPTAEPAVHNNSPKTPCLQRKYERKKSERHNPDACPSSAGLTCRKTTSSWVSDTHCCLRRMKLLYTKIVKPPERTNQRHDTDMSSFAKLTQIESLPYDIRDDTPSNAEQYLVS